MKRCDFCDHCCRTEDNLKVCTKRLVCTEDVEDFFPCCDFSITIENQASGDYCYCRGCPVCRINYRITMKALALLLIKVVGLSACILTAVAAIVVLASKLVDLGESFKDPEWMNQEKED